MIRSLSLVVSVVFLFSCKQEKELKTQNTYCNPIDISYRFCSDKPSRREAADPTVIIFKDRYFLFASKSGGYWHSEDLHHWTFIETNEIPIEEYAPTAIAIGDTVYFLASSNEKSTIYKSPDPLNGKWTVAKDSLDVPVWDPAFFLDDDERLYLFWGCSNVNPLYGVELDYQNNFAFIGKPKELIHANPAQNGWEVPGDYNTLTQQNPWIEGAWMNKYKGKYYLQYSGPGTEFKSYANGVYISDSPLGQYSLASHNPFSYKPEGFVNGAGHGSTFQDKYGNYWNISTGTISVKQMFERRLVLYPAFFDADGVMYTSTRFGDYPVMAPQGKISNADELFSDWMLLSYNRPIQVSSEIDSLPASHMTDENIRTYWAASNRSSKENAVLDLGNSCDVYALQINFAEHETELFDRQPGLFHRFTIEYSNDNQAWTMLVDYSGNQSDNSHPYIQLRDKVSCRYVRLTNLEVPGGYFAVSDFRVFGKGAGSKPVSVRTITGIREKENRRSVDLSWERSSDAIGYNILYGSDSAKLYHNYMVYGDTTVTINSLNASQKYYFAIESFNEAGIAPAKKIIRVD